MQKLEGFKKKIGRLHDSNIVADGVNAYQSPPYPTTSPSSMVDVNFKGSKQRGHFIFYVSNNIEGIYCSQTSFNARKSFLHNTLSKKRSDGAFNRIIKHEFFSSTTMRRPFT